MIDFYAEKKKYLYQRASGLCIGCKKPVEYRSAHLQHKAHNHKWRRNKFPYFLNSLLNLDIICPQCNCYTHRSAGKISDYKAERYERFLARHKKLNVMVNNMVY